MNIACYKHQIHLELSPLDQSVTIYYLAMCNMLYPELFSFFKKKIELLITVPAVVLLINSYYISFHPTK